jgi:hypothetical protein
MNLPDGDYHITLEHHPNQRKGVFLTTILDGEQAGRGFPYYAQGALQVFPFNRTIRKGRKNEN